MANQTNISDYSWSFEYYMDYLDILPVDASKLEANRYSIVIAFWIGLVSFVAFLFFILFYISRLDHTPRKSIKQYNTCPSEISVTSLCYTRLAIPDQYLKSTF